MVAGLCRALLRDVTEAEDATQQVFLSAHRSLLNGAESREPAAWLATIARNECWGRISGRMREPLPSAASDELAGSDDPVAEAIRRADLAALWRAIRRLPKPQREALLLREFGGLRYDELAAALAVTEPAVESLLFRARARLREQLQAAYASLAPLVRVLVSGGAPALATKAVALGLGAAAVTGTAVVAPSMLEHQSHATPRATHRRHVAPPPALQTAQVAVAQGPTIAAVVHQVASVQAPPPRRHEDRSGGGDHVATVEQHDATTQTHDGEHEHGDTQTTQTATSTPTSTAEREHSDGGDSHDQQPTTTTSPTTTTTTTTTTNEPTTTTFQVPDLSPTTATIDTSGDTGSDG